MQSLSLMRGAMVALVISGSLFACDGEVGEHGNDWDSDDDGFTGTGGSGFSSVMDLPVRLIPQSGVSGRTRVNFAVPLPPRYLRDEAAVRVMVGEREIPSAKRGLASYADGSLRSVQIQVELDVRGPAEIAVRLGERSVTGDLSMEPVASTLRSSDDTTGPKVWALLPSPWLASSGVAGPQVPDMDVRGTAADAWRKVCDYDEHNVDSFKQRWDESSVWLFDRGTALYRGYVRKGDENTLRSAYIETAIYRQGLSGQGTGTRIGISGKANDLKFHYTQNMAIHYLLTGDDRFREAAENVADRIAQLWSDPDYSGGSDFWTERHAGFGLLGYVWAMMVSDDRAGIFRDRADEAVRAYVAMQEGFPRNHKDDSARCFAHTGEAHGEPYRGFGCSPWMSAILADGLDAYARESDGESRRLAVGSLVKLGRKIARDGQDGSGKPYYWMSVDGNSHHPNQGNEHWGESAYVVALAYYHDGKKDPSLKSVAEDLMKGLREKGVAPHLRSFNWQCRSAVATPFYLR